ncbi:MAG: UvrB/UvrC motif-containing protein [Planctomycetota bacterium]
MLGVICQLCRQRPACVHLTEQQLHGQSRTVRSLDLCQNCLTGHEEALEGAAPAIEHILSDASSASEEEVPALQVPDKPSGGTTSTCPHCGLSLEQFLGNKRLGCQHDYDLFADTLIPLLEDYHGASHHLGRTPTTRSDGSIGRGIHKRMLYEKQLKTAIANEDYERAAELRDLLKQLGGP